MISYEFTMILANLHPLPQRLIVAAATKPQPGGRAEKGLRCGHVRNENQLLIQFIKNTYQFWIAKKFTILTYKTLEHAHDRDAEARKSEETTKLRMRKWGTEEVRKFEITQMRKSANAQVRKCANAQVRKNASAQVRKRASAQRRANV